MARRPHLNETTEEILQRHLAEAEAERRAAEAPHELDEADIDLLPAATVARLAERGHLFDKFGVPGRSGR